MKPLAMKEKAFLMFSATVGIQRQTYFTASAFCTTAALRSNSHAPNRAHGNGVQYARVSSKFTHRVKASVSLPSCRRRGHSPSYILSAAQRDRFHDRNENSSSNSWDSNRSSSSSGDSADPTQGQSEQQHPAAFRNVPQVAGQKATGGTSTFNTAAAAATARGGTTIEPAPGRVGRGVRNDEEVTDGAIDGSRSTGDISSSLGAEHLPSKTVVRNGPSSETTGPLLWLMGAMRALERLQRKVQDVPEGAADEGKFLMMAAVVGVLTGSAVTVFKTLIGATKEISYGDLIGRVPLGASVYLAAFIPILGAVGVVSIMRSLRLKSFGPGLGGLTEEVDRQIPWDARRTLGKTLAAVATLGTGNSLGPEGPAVELGVASSRFVSSKSHLSVERQRMLLGAGAAAGVAAGFNAPIAGIFFALEIVKDTFNTNYNSKSFIAATLLCAVVSALIAKIGLKDELALRPALYNLESPLIELPFYLGLGVVAGLVAVMFKYFSRKSADVFEGNFPGFAWMKTVPKWSKPIMMAAVTGLVGIFYPQVLFFGYDTLDKLLANTGSYSLSLLGFLCVAKALLTAGALGSGLVGGTFAPSLFLGATAGAAYQRILQGSLTAFKSAAGPSLITMSTFLTSRLGLGAGVSDVSSLLTIAGSPAYAMVGAAAVLSALYRAPLTGSLLLFELTKDYDIVLPLMAAAGVSSLVVEVFSRAGSGTPAPPAMPRDMSLEIGLKISSKVDALMNKVQSVDTLMKAAVLQNTVFSSSLGSPHEVADALLPRVLTLSGDLSLSDAMRAFHLTRNEFAVVVGSTGFETRVEETPPPGDGDAEGVNGATESGDVPGSSSDSSGNGSGWQAQTLLAEDLWERRDLRLIGVLALREILLALERERGSYRRNGLTPPKLTAGSVCRENCFTVKASTDIASARSIMNSKGVRFLPVVVDLPPSPAQTPSVVSLQQPGTGIPSEGDGEAAIAAGENGRDSPVGEDSSASQGSRRTGVTVQAVTRQRQQERQQRQQREQQQRQPQLAVVGVLSRDSVRIAGRLAETERAIRDQQKFLPPNKSSPPPPQGPTNGGRQG